MQDAGVDVGLWLLWCWGAAGWLFGVICAWKAISRSQIANDVYRAQRQRIWELEGKVAALHFADARSGSGRQVTMRGDVTPPAPPMAVCSGAEDIDFEASRGVGA